MRKWEPRLIQSDRIHVCTHCRNNYDVREHQKKLWMHIIYYHCFVNHIYSITPGDLQSSDIVKHPDLQSNKGLKLNDLEEILDYMKDQEFVICDKTYKSDFISQPYII